MAVRFGVVNTMIWTHAPASVILLFLPFAPSLLFAALLLWLRSLIGQMDVPARSTYLISVVPAEERSAALGITSLARTAASAVSPLISGAIMNGAAMHVPILCAGALKLIYDAALYHHCSLSCSLPEDEAAGVRNAARIVARSASGSLR
jgi:sugar phosphate permease